MQADEDKYANSGNESYMPGSDTNANTNPLAAISAAGSVNPYMFGGQGGGQAPPQFLSSPTNEKGMYMQAVYNTGTTYLLGLTVGGAYGVVEGFTTSPSSKFKIRFNSILNKCGTRGSRLGNALAMAALMYSSVEAGLHFAEFDKLVGDNDWASPVTAAAATGLLFKSTQGPKTMAVAGLMGGAIATTAMGARTALPNMPVLGYLFF